MWLILSVSVYVLLSAGSRAPQPDNISTIPITRGRPGRKPTPKLQKSFLIEKGVKGAQLKKELTLGGRVNVNNLDGGLWLNPTVVLRRLTVTIGGFRIELLPGPSYTQSVSASQSEGLDDGISHGGDIGCTMLSDDTVRVQNPIPENNPAMNVDNGSANDAALGPCVNPNDVQTSNGTLTEVPTMQESKVDVNCDSSEKEKTTSKAKDGVKQAQNNENTETTTSNKNDGKEKQHIVSKNVLKSKEGQISNKNKDISSKASSMKEHHVSQNQSSKVIQRGDLHKIKSLKERKNVSPLKRPAETTPSDTSDTKVQKVHSAGDVKAKSKILSTPSSLAKKTASSCNRVGDLGSVKPTNPHNSSKSETIQLANSCPGLPLKAQEEGGLEKPKVKKPEKLLARQKSKSSRSISVEEPQLFIPDNAPVVKKETAEDQSASSETAWDGNNCCGLCKKHHNNM